LALRKLTTNDNIIIYRLDLYIPWVKLCLLEDIPESYMFMKYSGNHRLSPNESFITQVWMKREEILKHDCIYSKS
jgi:hypothetical protein